MSKTDLHVTTFLSFKKQRHVEVVVAAAVLAVILNSTGSSSKWQWMQTVKEE